MPKRVTHGGTGLTVTEFQISTYDEFGDFIDTDHAETKAEAITLAKRWAENLEDGAIGVLVDRTVKKYPSHWHDQPNTFEEIATFGHPYPTGEDDDL